MRLRIGIETQVDARVATVAAVSEDDRQLDVEPADARAESATELVVVRSGQLRSVLSTSERSTTLTCVKLQALRHAMGLTDQQPGLRDEQGHTCKLRLALTYGGI